MTKEELDAIRERNEEARNCGDWAEGGSCEDVDALLAEVERLEEALRTRPVLLICEHAADGAMFSGVGTE